MIVTVLQDTEFRGKMYPAGTAVDMADGVALRMIAVSKARAGAIAQPKKKRGRKKK